MPTYRRFTCVERSIAFFLSQKTSLDKELIILNTDVEHPLELDDTFSNFEKSQIKIINNNTDYITKEGYECTGAIRRDAFTHTNGDFYITWDDDDIFLPWNIEQCYDGITRTGAGAWKPYYSFTWIKDRFSKWIDYRNTEIPKLQNYFLESSAIVKSEHVAFLLESGNENFGWYQPLVDSNNFTNAGPFEEDLAIPAYCFNWADDVLIGGAQKQSGTSSEDRKFQRHKRLNKDFAKRKLTKRTLKDYSDILEKCNLSLKRLDSKYIELIDKYIGSYNYF
jgi:hypothetical protein